MFGWCCLKMIVVSENLTTLFFDQERQYQTYLFHYNINMRQINEKRLKRRTNNM